MHKRRFAGFGLILVAVGLASCTGGARNTVSSDAEVNSTKESQPKSDDRGFDPCLINANLPVCTNK